MKKVHPHAGSGVRGTTDASLSDNHFYTSASGLKKKRRGV